MILSILICRLKSREAKYEALVESIYKQTKCIDGIEVRYLEDDGKLAVGTKRNSLMMRALGEYICYIDDDDRISDNYINQVMTGIQLGVDCCSMVGEITTDGKNPKVFVHSVDYDTYFEKNNVYYRPPNHLNVVRKSLVNRFHFPAISHGEDTDWAMQVARSKVLVNEYKVKETIYYYDYVSNK